MRCLFKVIVVAILTLLPALLNAAGEMPAVNQNSPLYEVKVEPGVSYDDVITSLKVASEGKNLVSPASFPISEHMKMRGLPVEGLIEVRTYCSLGVGAEIMLDHPEFAVFAPCRIAVYQKHGELYLGLDRPSYDLGYIRNPTQRALKAVKELEDALIWMMDKARKGEI